MTNAEARVANHAIADEEPVAARQESGTIKFEAGNPATDSWVSVNGHSDDRFAAREERDPFDADLPLTDPNPSAPFQVEVMGQLYFLGGDPFDLLGAVLLMACLFHARS